MEWLTGRSFEPLFVVQEVLIEVELPDLLRSANAA